MISLFETAIGKGCLAHFPAELKLNDDAGMHAMLKQSWLWLISMLEPSSMLSDVEFDSKEKGGENSSSDNLPHKHNLKTVIGYP